MSEKEIWRGMKNCTSIELGGAMWSKSCLKPKFGIFAKFSYHQKIMSS